MDVSLQISDEIRRFSVTKRIAIEIELKLNKSEYGWAWSHIGDILFKFGSSHEPIQELIVSSFQYEYLKNIYETLL
jgi:hypothetical protein